MNKISKIFQPMLTIPKNATVKKNELTSKSHKLMTELGLIRPATNGTFYLLPLVQRSIEKLIKIIDKHMHAIDAQKVTLPILTSAELWKKSGRLKNIGSEIMSTIDRHDHQQILSPTNEESVTALLASISPISYKQLPLKLYQIGTKFRDEMKPRFGLIRTKEFIMKDLYSFDENERNARHTYHEVCDIYEKLLQKIDVQFVKVNGDTGVMGGVLSHEYHLPATIGDDSLINCSDCNYAVNREMCSKENSKITCPNCGSENILMTQGIEVAHTFLLNDKYSKSLSATVLLNNGKTAPLVMGCYGIGVTRMIAASVEVLSTDNEIRWPNLLAPYLVCIISPKEGSKEQKETECYVEKIYNDCNQTPELFDNVIVDDRSHLTIGKRLLLAKRFGYPFVIVIGSKAQNETNAMFELHVTADMKSMDLQYDELCLEIRKHVNKFIGNV